MVELFAYSWFYNGYNIYGHCLDVNGKYTLLKVRGFYPSCYIEGDVIPASSIVPIKAEYKRMATSRNVSLLKPFYRLYFSTLKEMEMFLSETRVKRYMADMQQVTMFLSQIGADHVGWIKVTDDLNVFISNIIPVLNKIPFSNPRIMVFDIEVKSSDLGMPQPHRIMDTVEMISIVAFNSESTSITNKYILHTYNGVKLDMIDAIEVAYNNETDMIRGFFDIIKKEDPTVITGYNIFGFDMHYLVSRLQLRLLEIPQVSRGPNYIDIIRVDWSSDAYGMNKYDRLIIGGRIIIDMFLYFKRMKLDKYSLDFVSKKFLGIGKNSMTFDAMMNAFSCLDPSALKVVAEYCIQDSVLVMMLFEKVKMWIDLCEISTITRCNMEDIYTRGEQMKLISQCIKECMTRNIVLQSQEPLEWKDYEGAYVIDPKKGVYDGCCTLDFQSLYPSIIIAFNICPSTYCQPNNNSFVVGNHGFRKNPVGLLPGMIKSLLDKRSFVKDLMKKLDDKNSIEYIVLDRRQNALKTCANSVYGMMGFKKSRYFGHLGCAESVTTVGRCLLSNIVKEIESSYPVNVIYGDTDSCMLWHKNKEVSRDDMVELGNMICDKITNMLPKPMALKFESYYDKVVLLTKKRYILVNNGKASYKGVMNARRDYCKFAKDTYEGVIEMIATGNTIQDIKRYIDIRVLILLCGKCNVDDIVITKSLSRDLNSYKVNQPHVVFARKIASKTGVDIQAGTRLEYVYVKTEEEMVTPEDAKSRNLPIDGAFYVKKQIASQVDDVLSVIGLEGYIKNTWCIYLT